MNHSRGWPTIGQLAMDWKRSGLVKYHSTGLHFVVSFLALVTFICQYLKKSLITTQLTVFEELPIYLRKWMQNYNSVNTYILYQLKYSINHYMKIQKHAQSLCCAVCFLLPHLYTCPQSSVFIAFKTKKILKTLKKSSAADQLTTTCATLLSIKCSIELLKPCQSLFQSTIL